MKKVIQIFTVVIVIMSVGCKKDFLETSSSNQVLNSVLVDSISKISLILDGAALDMFEYNLSGTNSGHDFFGQKALDLSNDLVGEDMIVNAQGIYQWFNADYQYVEWTRDQTNRRSDNAWFYYYNLIGKMNNLLDNIETAKGGTLEQKQTIKGQALGLRAYCYFYLINYFQQTYKGNESKPGVPIILSLSNQSLNKFGRNTVEEVYTQINKDLNDAETLLDGKVITDKTLMNYNIVEGFKARVALLQEKWADAAKFAQKAYAGYPLMTAAEYKNGFSRLSTPEWMWGSLIPAAQATVYASFFSHIDITNQGYAYFDGQKKIPKSLFDKIPSGDVRKTLFTSTGASATDPLYNQKKFRVQTKGSWAADYIYMRAGEMYLIEAEAYARLGQEPAARTAIKNLVKNKLTSYNVDALTGNDLLNEILFQRKIELWGEGFSMMDIKRLKTGLNRTTGAGNHGPQNLDPVIYTLPDANPLFLMRIPRRELETNGSLSLSDQNP